MSVQIFDYKRLVSILLKMVSPSQGQDDFIQRIGIYLLNSLACQVDGKEKQMVGSLGAMQVGVTQVDVTYVILVSCK